MGAFYSQALQRIRGVPGVQAASAASVLPLTGQGHYINLQVEGHSAAAAERPFVDSASVLSGYFTTVHSPILQGRDFTDADRENTPPVAIVDNVLAARMWPGESPLGKRLRLADLGDSGPPWREVVGVIHPIKNFGPEQVFRRQQVYVPAYQLP